MGMFSGMARRSNTDQVKKEDSLEVKLNNFLSNDGDRNPDDYCIEDGKVNCKKNVYITDEDLIDGKLPFSFGKVDGCFICRECDSLTSLKGSPKEVRFDFQCDECPLLTSLEDCPEKVGGWFICNDCPSLTSLEGVPKEVDGNFECGGCTSLTSLKGAPEKVGGYFVCDGCTSLTSLEGAPKKVGDNLICEFCNSLTTSEIRRYMDKTNVNVLDSRFI